MPLLYLKTEILINIDNHSENDDLRRAKMGMWNSPDRCEKVYPKTLENGPCPISNLSWKFHEIKEPDIDKMIQHI